MYALLVGSHQLILRRSPSPPSFPLVWVRWAPSAEITGSGALTLQPSASPTPSHFSSVEMALRPGCFPLPSPPGSPSVGEHSRKADRAKWSFPDSAFSCPPSPPTMGLVTWSCFSGLSALLTHSSKRPHRVRAIFLWLQHLSPS